MQIIKGGRIFKGAASLYMQVIKGAASLYMPVVKGAAHYNAVHLIYAMTSRGQV